MILLQYLAESEIEDHLRSRGLDPSRTHVIIDQENGMATFLLYNLSGQLIGYQRYNPKGVKTKKGSDIDTALERYYTWVTKEGGNTPKLAVWGLETIFEDTPWFFVTEGIFDCIKLQNAGYPAIAVLANNPKPLRGWFKTLGKTVIAVTDRDQAGQKLKNIADYHITVPEPYKDLGDMPQEEVDSYISGVLGKTSAPKPQAPETIRNPETGNEILMKTALNYPPNHPARREAERIMDKLYPETLVKAANRGPLWSENKT